MNEITIFGLKHLKDIVLNSKIHDLNMESNEEIISRLKFIGYIQKDEKINVRHVNRQPNNWYTIVSRAVLWPDNRNNTLKFIREIISRTFDIIDNKIRTGDTQGGKAIIIDLIKAQQGMINMKHTYSEDTKFCCDIDVLIERVASKLSLLREDNSALFEEHSE